MDKKYYDICYDILSHYLHFPDVADTYKSIKDAENYRDNFPRNPIDFQLKKDDIIAFIKTVRLDNIIDSYQNQYNPLMLVPVPSGKKLSDANPQELYNNLTAEIPRLILKGIHQTIKHLNIITDDNQLTSELLQQDTAVLQKYNLQGAKEN